MMRKRTDYMFAAATGPSFLQLLTVLTVGCQQLVSMHLSIGRRLHQVPSEIPSDLLDFRRRPMARQFVAKP